MDEKIITVFLRRIENLGYYYEKFDCSDAFEDEYRGAVHVLHDFVPMAEMEGAFENGRALAAADREHDENRDR